MRRFYSTLAIGIALAGASIAGSTETEIIVTLKQGQSIEHVNRSAGTRTADEIPGSGIYLLRTDRNATAVLEKLGRDPRVESAEENKRIRLNEPADPARTFSGLSTDTVFLLDGVTTTPFYGADVLRAYAEQPALSITKADQARRISTGAGARVAYIDTGVDPAHPALQPWLDPGFDLVAGRSVSEMDGLLMDTMYLLDADTMFLLDKRFQFLLNHSLVSLLNSGSVAADFPPAFGHGTLVAGILHVVAPEARIVPIKAFDANGYTTLFKVVEAVHLAADLQVDVLNMSFSTQEASKTLRNAISKAAAAGVDVIASAGNDGEEANETYPAAWPEVIGVAATDFNDRIAPFSNYGKSVSLAAPGAFVVSTVPGGKYAAAWGTSFSAPIVSGAVALLESYGGFGHSSGPLVITTAEPIDALNPSYKNLLGSGRLDIQRAVEGRR